MNTVGPYHNRQETYGYFTLPFCVGPKDSISHYHETLGEALQVLFTKTFKRWENKNYFFFRVQN